MRSTYTTGDRGKRRRRLISKIGHYHSEKMTVHARTIANNSIYLKKSFKVSTDWFLEANGNIDACSLEKKKKTPEK